MKIRTDFVTNSSSSSFIIAFKDKATGLEEIENLKHRFGSDAVDALLTYFDNASPLSEEQLYKELEEEYDSEAQWSLYDSGCGRQNTSFEYIWKMNHPDAKWSDMYSSEEYKTALNEKKQEYLDEFYKDNCPSQYGHIVALEIGDHSYTGSDLEHEILPKCDFVLQRFSHH